MTHGAEKDPAQQQFTQLLGELRVALPGVQVLLAFLLTVPFTSRFETLSPLDTAVFTFGVGAAAVAIVLLIAPSAQHRVAWRSDDTNYARLLRLANREALAGLLGVALSMAASIFVVLDVVYHQPLTAIAGAALVGLMGWLWLALPLRLRAA